MTETEEFVLEVDHDELISQIDGRMAEEYARGSDASESAAKTKVFLEKTGMNSQAFSWLKTIVKKNPKKDGQTKAMDVIRSLEVGLEMIKNHVQGQMTAEMNFGDEEEVEEVEVEKPVKKAAGKKTAKAADNVKPIDFPAASKAAG